MVGEFFDETRSCFMHDYFHHYRFFCHILHLDIRQHGIRWVLSGFIRIAEFINQFTFDRGFIAIVFLLRKRRRRPIDFNYMFGYPSCVYYIDDKRLCRNTLCERKRLDRIYNIVRTRLFILSVVRTIFLTFYLGVTWELCFVVEFDVDIFLLLRHYSYNYSSIDSRLLDHRVGT